MKNNINTKELIKGISVIFAYFIIPSILFIPFYFLYNYDIWYEKYIKGTY